MPGEPKYSFDKLSVDKAADGYLENVGRRPAKLIEAEEMARRGAYATIRAKECLYFRLRIPFVATRRSKIYQNLMSGKQTKDRGLFRAIAVIALAYLVVLNSIFVANILATSAFAADQPGASGWTICYSDERAPDEMGKSGTPAGHLQHHCALCAAAAAASIVPPAGTIGYLIPRRIAAVSPPATVIASLWSSGWSSSWSSRAPPFIV
jgi:hypothetical protein